MSMKTIGFGRIVRQPKLFPNRENPACYLTVAHDEGKGEYRKGHFTTFTAYGALAETLAKWGTKGRLIYVDAVPTSWVQETDQGNRSREAVVLRNFEFLDSKPKIQSESEDLPPPEMEEISSSSEEEVPAG